jgi:single-strand DNA-binding protein
MQSDTSKFLTTGSTILLIGVLAAILMLTVFGGVTRQGPHTNLGWTALVVAMGCLPLGLLSLLLGSRPPQPPARPRQTPRQPQPAITAAAFPSTLSSDLCSLISLPSLCYPSLLKRSILMAKGVNKVILLGNVGKDPEIRTSAGGMTIASFSLATAERAKDQQGNWTDKTEWHNLVAFQRTAEIVRDYVKKGSQLYIEGRIQTRSWDDKESGQKKYKTEILVNDLQLLGGRGEGAGSSRSEGSSSRSSSYSGGSGSAPAPANDYADQGITDEDIPF